MNQIKNYNNHIVWKMKHLNSFEEYKVYYSNHEVVSEHDYGFYCDMEKYNIRDIIPLYGIKKWSTKKEIDNIDTVVKERPSIIFLNYPIIYCINIVCSFSFIIGNCLHLFAQSTIDRVGFLVERLNIR